jgi:hypothetical protein
MGNDKTALIHLEREKRDEDQNEARSNLAETRFVLWVKWFSCAIRNTGDMYCDRPVSSAAARPQIRIISPSRNVARSDAE